MRIVNFYLRLLKENTPWIKRISLWGLFWLSVGIGTFLIRPELLGKFIKLLNEIFRQKLGTEALVLSFHQAVLIWRQNLLVALLSITLGVIVGLAPLLIVAVNFFILGFLFAAMSFSSLLGGKLTGIGLFVASTFPHSLLELPAFIIVAAFSLRLGFSWWTKGGFRTAFKEAMQIFPLVVLLLFFAALIEIFITGGIIHWLTK